MPTQNDPFAATRSHLQPPTRCAQLGIYPYMSCWTLILRHYTNTLSDVDEAFDVEDAIPSYILTGVITTFLVRAPCGPLPRPTPPVCACARRQPTACGRLCADLFQLLGLPDLVPATPIQTHRRHTRVRARRTTHTSHVRTGTSGRRQSIIGEASPFTPCCP